LSSRLGFLHYRYMKLQMNFEWNLNHSTTWWFLGREWLFLVKMHYWDSEGAFAHDDICQVLIDIICITCSSHKRKSKRLMFVQNFCECVVNALLWMLLSLWTLSKVVLKTLLGISQGHPIEYFGEISVRMEGGLKISKFFRNFGKP